MLVNVFPDNLKIILIASNFKEPTFYLEHTKNIDIGAVLIGENMNIDVIARTINLTENAGWWEKNENGGFFPLQLAEEGLLKVSAFGKGMIKKIFEKSSHKPK